MPLDQTQRLDASLDATTARFIEAQAFFILGTADERGDCDCSYRGRAQQPDGTAQPLLRIVDAAALVFPDFSGNNLFNSIGNLLRNPQLALLFVDFERGASVGVIGRAAVEPATASAWLDQWPAAHAVVMVGIERVVAGRHLLLPALRPVRTATGDWHGDC